MQRIKRAKVIIDTNLFISFLIGKRLKRLKNTIVDNRIILIFSEQIIEELLIVTSREKFNRYFDKQAISELVAFIRLTGTVYAISNINPICRDPKDDFLLALAKKSNADYLVTGDKDLLTLQNYNNTNIINMTEFEFLLESISLSKIH